MSEIDDLLSQIKAEYQESPGSPKKPPEAMAELLEQVQAEISSPPKPPATPPRPPQPQKDLELERKKRRQQALEEKARQWLTSLDPQSEEGRWFQEFAYSYDSRVQAAVDYLEALRETGSS